MTRPGMRLRARLAPWCSEKMLRQRIDPAIADLQAEYREAAREGRTWKARWTWLRGHAAIAKLLAACLWDRLLLAVDAWNEEDSFAIARVMGFAVAGMVAAILLQALPVYSKYAAPLLDGQQLWLVLYLLPFGLCLALPVGLMFGILCGLRSTISRQLTIAIVAVTLAASAVSLVNVTWITPVANQTFRRELFHRAGGVGPLARGTNELTLFEARRHYLSLESRGYRARRAAVGYYHRWALGFAPLALGCFALSVRTRRLRWKLAAAAGTVALFAYYFGGPGDLAASLAIIPAPLIAWLPNLLFMAAAARNFLRMPSRAVAGGQSRSR